MGIMDGDFPHAWLEGLNDRGVDTRALRQVAQEIGSAMVVAAIDTGALLRLASVVSAFHAEEPKVDFDLRIPYLVVGNVTMAFVEECGESLSSGADEKLTPEETLVMRKARLLGRHCARLDVAEALRAVRGLEEMSRDAGDIARVLFGSFAARVRELSFEEARLVSDSGGDTLEHSLLVGLLGEPLFPEQLARVVQRTEAESNDAVEGAIKRGLCTTDAKKVRELAAAPVPEGAIALTKPGRSNAVAVLRALHKRIGTDGSLLTSSQG